MSIEFTGFSKPNSNYFKLPNEWVNLTAGMGSLSEMKIVEYILRHTWGFQEFNSHKKITLDEFQNGRKRKDGSRMDLGTGLSKTSIIHGIKEAIEHGYIIQFVDNTNLSKIINYYKIRIIGDPPEKIYIEKPTEANESSFSRKKIFERDKYRCQHCESWIDLTVDHIIPRLKGGSNKDDNLQTLCRSCNSKKGIK